MSAGCYGSKEWFRNHVVYTQPNSQSKSSKSVFCGDQARDWAVERAFVLGRPHCYFRCCARLWGTMTAVATSQHIKTMFFILSLNKRLKSQRLSWEYPVVTSILFTFFAWYYLRHNIKDKPKFFKAEPLNKYKTKVRYLGFLVLPVVVITYLSCSYPTLFIVY